MPKTTNRKWKFRLAEPIANLSQLTLEENIVFWETRLKFWFYGYKTNKEVQLDIWGKKVALTLEIAPLGTPTEDLPTTPKASAKSKKVSPLSPEKQAYIEQLQARVAELKALLPPPPDEAMERRYWDYLDPERFLGGFQKAILIWNDTSLELSAKIPQMTEHLAGIHEALRGMHLPEELMRDDTQFSLALAKVLQFIQIIVENAEKNQVPLPPFVRELESFIDTLTDQLIEGGNKLYAHEPAIPEATGKAKDDFSYLKFEGLFVESNPIETRLELLEQIWNHPLADTDDKIMSLEKAIELTQIQAKKQKAAPVPCPHKDLVEKHLAAISRYIREVEEEGEAIWQGRMAEEMLDSVNHWRESAKMPLLTKESFAPQITLETLHMETHELEGGEISYRLGMYFKDKDNSFDVHFMFAQIENGKIEEITLMG